MLIGYARVSTDDQNLDLQKDALTNAGLQAARVRGRKGGRPKALDADKRSRAVRPYDERKHSIDQICNMVGISKLTLYKYEEAERKSREA